MKDMGVTKKTLKSRIEAARGLAKPDLVIKEGNVVNVFTGGINITDVAIIQVSLPGQSTRSARPP